MTPKPTPAGRITVTELKRETGTDPVLVKKWLAEAKIARRSSDKTWPRVKALNAINARKDQTLTTVHRAGRGKVNGDVSSVAGAAHAALSSAKADAERERHRKLKLDNDRREGNLIDRTKITATAKAIVGTVRTSLLSVPDRVAPKLVGLNDPTEISEILENEIRACLSSIATASTFEREVMQ